MIKLFRRGVNDDDLNSALTASYRHAAFVVGAPADDNQIHQELSAIRARSLGTLHGRDDFALKARHLNLLELGISAVTIGVYISVIVFLTIAVFPRLRGFYLAEVLVTTTVFVRSVWGSSNFLRRRLASRAQSRRSHVPGARPLGQGSGREHSKSL